jgi:hypothetical protein
MLTAMAIQFMITFIAKRFVLAIVSNSRHHGNSVPIRQISKLTALFALL